MIDDELGWVAIEQLLSATEVASVLTAIKPLFELPPAERRAGDKPAAGTRHLEELDDRVPQVAEILDREVLMTAVEGLLGPNPTRTQVSLRDPQPGFGGQRLHADGFAKLDVGPATIATAIIALVDFDATNGATRVIAGSHRRPDLQRRSGSLESHPDETFLAGPAGAAFVFDGNLLHAGGRNNSRNPRPALQVLWRRQQERRQR